MQGLPLEYHFNPLPPSLGNPSHEGTIDSHPESKTRSGGHPNHQTEGKVEVIKEGFILSNDLPLTKPTIPPLLEVPHSTNATNFL